MMTRALVVVVAFVGMMPLSIAACGGDLRPPDHLPPGAEGTWNGLFTFAMTGQAPRTYDGVITLSADDEAGRGVSLDGMCPSSQMATLVGFDGVYMWAGEMECAQPIWLGSCPGIYLTLTGIRLEILDNIVKVRGTGMARAPQCNIDAPITLEFDGRRSP